MGPDGSTWPFLVIIVLNPTIRLYRLSGPRVKSNQFTMSKTLNYALTILTKRFSENSSLPDVQDVTLETHPRTLVIKGICGRSWTLEGHRPGFEANSHNVGQII